MSFLRTRLDHSIVISVAAMLALNVIVLADQLHAAPTPALASATYSVSVA